MVSKCKFINNKGYSPTISNGGDGSIIITDSIFDNDGFSVHNKDIYKPRRSITINNSTFKNARSEFSPIYNWGVMKITKSTFTHNAVNSNTLAKDYAAGAITNLKGSMTISSSTFKKNKGKSVGAIKNGASLTVSGSTFTDNVATANVVKAGAIYNHNFSKYYPYILKVTNTKFKNNLAGKTYKAIFNDKGSEFTKKNVEITPKDGTKPLKVLVSKAKISGKNVVISISLDKSKVKTGKTIVKLKTPVKIIYKSFKISLGSAKYDKKVKMLTWTIDNKALAKKQATIKWGLKANKKGSYKVTPSIHSTGNKITNKKDINFKIK